MSRKTIKIIVDKLEIHLNPSEVETMKKVLKAKPARSRKSKPTGKASRRVSTRKSNSRKRPKEAPGIADSEEE